MTLRSSIAMALSAGILLGSAASTAVVTLSKTYPELLGAAQVRQPRELPLEWRRAQPAVTFDHMFMPDRRGR